MDIAAEILPSPEASITSCALSLKATLCCRCVPKEKQTMAERKKLQQSTPAKPNSDGVSGSNRNADHDAKDGQGKEAKVKEQARKKPKLEVSNAEGAEKEESYCAVIGPVPPPMFLCDIPSSLAPKMEGKTSTALQPYNCWESLEPLKALAKKTEIFKKVDLSKLPKNIEEALIAELKERSARVKTIEPKDLLGRSCTLADLRRALAAETGMAEGEFYMLKWFFQGLRWHVLTPDLPSRMLRESKMDEEVVDSAGDGKGEHLMEEDEPNSTGDKENTVSLTEAPLSFRDGDFVAALRKDEFGRSLSFDDIERIVGKLGPRHFITSRKNYDPTASVERFTPKEHMLRIDV